MKRRIAIVEDEPAIRENYADALRREGYAVEAYADRMTATTGLGVRLPDLILLDIGLGGEPEAGFELCRELRARSKSLPIIFLTARDSDLDVISGLRLGADDYLTKDISLPHLLARLSAFFRRLDAFSNAQAHENLIERGALTLDVDRLVALWRGEPVDLTLTEFWMVHALANRAGHVKSREQLMQEARIVVDDATITSHVKRMRNKFIARDASFEGIETVYGAGYRWVERG